MLGNQFVIDTHKLDEQHAGVADLPVVDCFSARKAISELVAIVLISLLLDGGTTEEDAVDEGVRRLESCSYGHLKPLFVSQVGIWGTSGSGSYVYLYRHILSHYRWKTFLRIGSCSVGTSRR